jgi:TctA family transporter
LSLGVHAVNNLATLLIANYNNSALPSPSIFTVHLDPLFNLISFIVIAIVFCLILLKESDRYTPRQSRDRKA